MPRTMRVVMPRSQINRRPYDVPANIADVCTSGRHRGTAVGNSWHRMDIVRCPHGHRAMSQPMCTKILPWDRAALGRRPAGFRPEIGRFPYGNPTMEHTSYDHRGIIGRTPSDVRRITVRCPACKSLHPTFSLCECFIKRFQMNISCKISDEGMTHITANPPQQLHRS